MKLVYSLQYKGVLVKGYVSKYNPLRVIFLPILRILQLICFILGEQEPDYKPYSFISALTFTGFPVRRECSIASRMAMV